MARLLRSEPSSGDTYTLPSGNRVVVLSVARDETIMCHYLNEDGSRQRGKSASVALTIEFMTAHCKQRHQ